MIFALLIIAILLLAYGVWTKNIWIAGTGGVILLVLLILALVGFASPSYRWY